MLTLPFSVATVEKAEILRITNLALHIFKVTKAFTLSLALSHICTWSVSYLSICIKSLSYTLK